MIIYLTEAKLQTVIKQCQEMFGNPQITLLKLTKLISLLPSTYSSGRLTSKNLVRESPGASHLSGLKLQSPYQIQVTLNDLFKAELLWTIENLNISGIPRRQESQVVIKTDTLT